MKNKRRHFVSLFVVLCMALTMAMPVCVWADEVDENSGSCSSHVYNKEAACEACGIAKELSSAVKEAWAAYYDLRMAYAGNDLEALIDAYNAVETANDGLDWSDTDDLLAMDEDYFVTLMGTSIVMRSASLQDEYKADPNVKTAYEFVAYYGMEDIEDTYRTVAARFVPDIDETFAAAKADMPSASAMAVYDAYSMVSSVVSFPMVYEETYTAYDAFEAVVDTYEALTDEEWADIALLIGAEDADAAKTMVARDWNGLNAVLDMETVYQAYMDDPNEETAKAFIDMYDSIFGDASEVTAEVQEIVTNFFYSIEDSYAEAKAMLAGPAEEEPADAEPNDAEAVAESPATGDDSAMLPWIAMMFAAGAVLAGVRRAKREV